MEDDNLYYEKQNCQDKVHVSGQQLSQCYDSREIDLTHHMPMFKTSNFQDCYISPN